MKTIIRKFTVICALFFLWSSGIAQEDVFFLGNPMGVGIKALSMGGAYVAVADNNSAAFWNPAGLGQLRRMEMNLEFSHNQAGSEALFLGNQNQANQSFTRLNSIGFSYPVPTYQGSLVLTIAYNKVRDFDDVDEVRGFNTHYSPFPDFFKVVDGREDFSTTVDDSLQQYESYSHQGSLNHFTIAGAIEVAPKFFTGISINFISGADQRAMQFQEDDIYNIYNIPYQAGDTIVSDLKRWQYYQNLTYKFSGTGIKFGALYCYGNMLRLGATVTPPLKYKIRWDWNDRWTETYDDDAQTVVPEAYDDGDFIIEQPFSFEGGASLQFLNVLVSGSVEFQDWTQAKIKTEVPELLYGNVSKTQVNAIIKKTLASTTKFRLGAEFYVPVIKARLNAGYFYNPSAYRDEAVNSDRHTFSGGFHFQAGRQAMVTLGIAQTLWKYQTVDAFANDPAWFDDPDWDAKKLTVLEDKSVTSLYAGLTVRF